jgi:hypothetical protein
MAAVLSIMPFLLVRYFVRQRWKTGRWFPTKEAAAQSRAQCAVLRSGGVAAGPPYSWIMIAVRWAESTAMEPRPLWQRMLSWTFIVLHFALMLAILAVSLISFGASFADGNTFSARLLFIGLGALLLILPIHYMRFRIRRNRSTGSFFASREEFHQIRTQSAASMDRERLRPLRYKLLFIALATAFLSGWWWISLHSPHQSWLNPAFWTLVFTYMAWNQFRKPKVAQPQASVPPAATQV